MNEQLPTFWVTGYLPNGVKVSYTVPIPFEVSPYEAAMQFTNMLLQGGFLLHEPGLEVGEEKERIVTVMRREKPSDGTPIIDMFPQWGAGGDEPFGTYKYLHVYLNTPEDIAAFLSAAGLKSLDQIPLYDGQGALRRTAGKKHPKEFTPPQAFMVVRAQGKEKTGSDGQPYRPWELVRYEPVSPAPAPAVQPPTAGLNDKLGAGDNRRMASEPPAANGSDPLDKLLKDCWSAFYKAVDPLFKHTNHRQNFMEKHLNTGDIKPLSMTGHQAVEFVKRHLEAEKAG